MSEPVREVVCRGVAASPGLVLGRIVLHHATRHARRQAGPPEDERRALEGALAVAARQLGELMSSSDDMAAEILEFQLALLEDEDLLGPVFAMLAEGTSADQAWSSVLDREIADYEAMDDPTFRARAADLVDLRDRVLDALLPVDDADGTVILDDGILVADDLTPSRFLETDWRRFRGAALRRGSAAGHVALLARARGTPLVVGLGDAIDSLREGALAVLDAEVGRLIVDPLPSTLERTETRRARRATLAARAQELIDRPAVTASGEPVAVLINVDDPGLLEHLDPAHCDGIGLTRTEFLFQGAALPDEERQYRIYRRILDWADGRKVVIRTLDAGGDKPVAGLTPEGEGNPFLGLRGIRLSLARPEVLRTQLRALARAAAHGLLAVMVPMVTVPAELDTVRDMLGDVMRELAEAGVNAAMPALGMMVEAPAAALDAAAFAADFFSIGSNDLIQYVMAASRDNPAVAGLYQPRHPAVLELIRRVVDVGKARGIEVSLCGDMASDPDLVPLLLDLGLRQLSVAPASIGAVKLAIAGWRPGDAHG